MLSIKANPDAECDVIVLQDWVKSLQNAVRLMERLQVSQEETIKLLKQIVTINEEINKDLITYLISDELIDFLKSLKRASRSK